jgi:broad specificity phosphatase PhoE
MASEFHVSDQKAAKPPAQILIIRHGEKPGNPGVDSKDDGINLSTKGYERAAALAFHIPAAFGKIDHLFATQPSTHSARPVETITPLAAALNLEINSHFKDDHFKEIAAHILGNPKYSDERILICWHHGKIPQLAAALLRVANPPSPWQDKWSDKVFDRVWIIDYATDSAVLKVVPQKLLYGDIKRIPDSFTPSDAA